MKRFFLSSIVIGSFVLFSLYFRLTGQATAVPIPPNTPSSPNPTVPSTVTSPPNSPSSTTNAPQITNPPPIATNTPASGFKDGSFTGDVVDAYYGNIQVQTVIQGGKITDVQFLQYPSDRSHSVMINQYAMPLLKSEAIQAQNANVNIVSGATDSSQAFVQSLQSALNKAKM